MQYDNADGLGEHLFVLGFATPEEKAAASAALLEIGATVSSQQVVELITTGRSGDIGLQPETAMGGAA